jgi:Putative lumazine-binding
MTTHEEHSQAQIDSDDQVRAKITETILNYVESWYEGDPNRTELAVHPDLAKRIVEVARNGREFLEHMGSLELIQNTRRGTGRQTPASDREKFIEIFAVNNNIATAKVVAAQWVDYLHLARINGAWRIVNALWALKPKT